MNKKIISKLLILIFLIALIIQTGLISYSIQENGSTGAEPTYEEIPSEEYLQVNTIEIITISEEIKNIIEISDQINFEKNLTNYKTLLTEFNVQKTFQDEIERLLNEGHKLPDILTAYEFLNIQFGRLEELEMLVQQKKEGKTWTQIFTAYNTNIGEFIPRAFDPDYLEKLMNNSRINTDDIMIADMISAKLQKPYEEIIDSRIAGLPWKEINEELGILNNTSELPRVQVTNEQIDKYISLTGLSEDVILDGFILAKKLKKSEKEIIDKMKAGYSSEKIYNEYFIQRYY